MTCCMHTQVAAGFCIGFVYVCGCILVGKIHSMLLNGKKVDSMLLTWESGSILQNNILFIFAFVSHALKINVKLEWFFSMLTCFWGKTCFLWILIFYVLLDMMLYTNKENVLFVAKTCSVTQMKISGFVWHVVCARRLQQAIGLHSFILTNIWWGKFICVHYTFGSMYRREHEFWWEILYTIEWLYKR